MTQLTGKEGEWWAAFRRAWQLLLVITLLAAVAASAGYWQNETPIGQTDAGDRMDFEGYLETTNPGNDR